MTKTKLIKSERDEEKDTEVHVYRTGRTYHAEIWSHRRQLTIQIGRECATVHDALNDVDWKINERTR